MPCQAEGRTTGRGIEIRTANLTIRPLEEADVGPPYVSWLNDPEVNRFLESRFREHDLASTRQYVRRAAVDPACILFGMFFGPQRRHIGNIKLSCMSREHHRGTLGLMVGDKSLWGRGLATESIAAVTRFAFDELGLMKLDAGGYASNEASRRAFLKAGWRQEGCLRSQVLCDGRREDQWLVGVIPDDLDRHR